MKQITWNLKAGTLTLKMDEETATITSTRQQVAFFDRIKQMENDWDWQCDSLMSDMKAVSATTKMACSTYTSSGGEEPVPCTVCGFPLADHKEAA